MRPIDLGLLSGKHLKLQERFASLRAQAGNGPAQLHDASAVPAITNHLVDAGGTQSGMLFQNEAVTSTTIAIVAAAGATESGTAVAITSGNAGTIVVAGGSAIRVN